MWRVRRVAFIAAVGLLVPAAVLAWWRVSQMPPEESALAATQGQFYLALAAILGSVLAWFRTRSRSASASGVPILAQVDALAAVVERQWRDEAARRKLLAPAPIPVRWTPSITALAGSVEGAIGVSGQPRAFPALPGVQPTSERQLLAGGGILELRHVYGGLASGRLVVTGPPGVGKSAAGILLLLDALTHRAQLPDDERGRVPVPVMFAVADWDPDAQSFRDWLANKVAPYLRGGRQLASKLVAEGRLAAIVDGLDEIDASLRAKALESMSNESIRLVLLSRDEELAAATREYCLIDAAVLELTEVEATTAASYLSRSLSGEPPAHWNDFLRSLESEPHGAIATVLKKPLYIALVRDVYSRKGDIGDLLDLARTAQPRAVEDHLLDELVEVAYSLPRKRRKFRPSPQRAKLSLAIIADHMAQEDTRELAWWNLYRWAPARPRELTTAISFGLLIGMANGSTIGLLSGLASGLATGLLIGFFIALARDGEVNASDATEGASRIAGVSRQSLVLATCIGVGSGIAVAPALGGALGLAVGLVVGLVDLLTVALADHQFAGATGRRIHSASPLTPTAAWRKDRRAGLTVGLSVGMAVVLTLVLFLGLDVRALYYGTAFGLPLSFMGPNTFYARLTFIQLARRDHLPIRLMRFLEDARHRGILRTVGPVYQFRHERLQNRLAHEMRVHRRGRRRTQPRRAVISVRK